MSKKEFYLGYNDLQNGQYYTTHYIGQGLYTFRNGYDNWVRHDTGYKCSTNSNFRPANGFIAFRPALKHEIAMLEGNDIKVKTLSDYLKSIGKAGGYVDKRKEHYRIKTVELTPKELEFLNNIPGVTAENQWLASSYSRYSAKVRKGIIRTDIKPKEKTIN